VGQFVDGHGAPRLDHESVLEVGFIELESDQAPAQNILVYRWPQLYREFEQMASLGLLRCRTLAKIDSGCGGGSG